MKPRHDHTEPHRTDAASFLIAGRAERVQRLLAEHGSDDDLQACLSDLLADAMHWCDATGQDFHISRLPAASGAQSTSDNALAVDEFL